MDTDINILQFKKMLGVSLALHASFLVFMTLKAAFLPKEPLFYESAVKVDLIDLPDKMPQSAPTEATHKTQMANPSPPKVTKKKLSLDKIKEFEKQERRSKALDMIKQEVQNQEKQERTEKVKKLLAKGNAISAGTSLTGTAKTEFNEYIDKLNSQVREHWNLPEWLANANLKAWVAVYLDQNGNVQKRVLLKSSGDSRFDNLALKAIDDSSPFPAPPGKFTEIVAVDGIRFRFPQ